LDKNESNVNKTEDASTGFKRLFAIVEANEFADLEKKLGEIRKRVEKLYTAERARLFELQDERARIEDEKNAEDDRAVAEERTAEPVKDEKPEPAAERAAPEAVQAEKSADGSAREPKTESGSDGAKNADAQAKPEKTAETRVIAPLGANVEPVQSNTRTAIPSYIRGVVKHVTRPAPTGKPTRPASSSPRGDRPGAPRPAGARPVGGIGGTRTAMPKFEAPSAPRKRDAVGKKQSAAKPDDKRQMNKRMLIRKGYIQENLDEERMGTRKLKNKKVNKIVPFAPIKIENAVITTENLTVKILSEKIGKTAQEIIKQLMELGIMTTINSVVDFPTMQLVADALGVNIELKLEKTKEEKLAELHAEPDPEESLVKRPPIITVMGHVDHGKTSLLDAIRKTSVASGEAGGITQHIGAYSVDVNGEKITFLDTPGHEAFTEMRRRGANVTDIAVLIVAADDGVMPQTIEAINHAKAAGVPIVVAVNKIDKPGANPERVIQKLAEYGLICEEWGGDVPMIPISAKQNKGIDKLLENILFRAEMLNLRANPKRGARGYVVEARLDKGKGPVATVIVQNGTLKVGDYVVSGTTYGKIRLIVDDKGNSIKSAPPSMPVAVNGLAQVPSAGDLLVTVESEKMAKQVIEERTAKAKNEMLSDVPTTDIDKAFGNADAENLKEIKLVVKADVQGSSEALTDALVKLSGDEVKVSVVYSGVGAVNQSDVMMADVSKANIIAFNVKPDSDARNAAERLGISIKQYSIIYEALDDVRAAMEELFAPKFVERVTGKAIVRTAFRVSGMGFIAGSYVQSGKIVRSGKARLYRGDKLIFEGDISGLKRFKDDAKEVTIGLECGIALDGYTEFLEDDILECYVIEKETKEAK